MLPRKDYLDNDDFRILWHGFDGSVIFNKQTGQQEWVRNADLRIPRRPRFSYKKRYGC